MHLHGYLGNHKIKSKTFWNCYKLLNITNQSCQHKQDLSNVPRRSGVRVGNKSRWWIFKARGLDNHDRPWKDSWDLISGFTISTAHQHIMQWAKSEWLRQVEAFIKPEMDSSMFAHWTWKPPLLNVQEQEFTNPDCHLWDLEDETFVSIIYHCPALMETNQWIMGYVAFQLEEITAKPFKATLSD